MHNRVVLFTALWRWLSKLRHLLLRDSRTSYWRSVIRVRFVVVAVAMMVFGHLLSRLWIVQIASHAGLGAMMAAVPARPVKYVAVVTINDADYRKFFAARSPLDAAPPWAALGGAGKSESSGDRC